VIYIYIYLAIRIRPITEEDLKNFPTKYQHEVISSSSSVSNQVIVQDGDKKHTYKFDHVFAQETTQKDVFEKSVLKLVEKFLEGKKKKLFYIFFYISHIY
jgi:hypothetical protein